jgi:hypothetical protein
LVLTNSKDDASWTISVSVCHHNHKIIETTLRIDRNVSLGMVYVSIGNSIKVDTVLIISPGYKSSRGLAVSIKLGGKSGSIAIGPRLWACLVDPFCIIFKVCILGDVFMEVANGDIHPWRRGDDGVGVR